MKYLKTLTLAAVAAGALMASVGAGTSSATELCSTTTVFGCFEGQKVIGRLAFTLASGTSTSFKETSAPEGEGGTLETCKSSEEEGEVTKSGSPTATPTWSITKLTWGSCTFPIVTTLKGSLEIHKLTGTSNGTVTADGETRVTINTIFFGTCVYGTNTGDSMGDLTEGNPAVFHAKAVFWWRSGGVFCPSGVVWSATYTLTSPTTTVSVS